MRRQPTDPLTPTTAQQVPLSESRPSSFLARFELVISEMVLVLAPPARKAAHTHRRPTEFAHLLF